MNPGFAELLERTLSQGIIDPEVWRKMMIIEREEPTAISTHPVEKPTAITAASVEKSSLKDAEDKVVKILSELDSPMQHLLYRVLYLSGIRIEMADTIVRQNFKI